MLASATFAALLTPAALAQPDCSLLERELAPSASGTLDRDAWELGTMHTRTLLTELAAPGCARAQADLVLEGIYTALEEGSVTQGDVNELLEPLLMLRSLADQLQDGHDEIAKSRGFLAKEASQRVSARARQGAERGLLDDRETNAIIALSGQLWSAAEAPAGDFAWLQPAALPEPHVVEPEDDFPFVDKSAAQAAFALAVVPRDAPTTTTTTERYLPRELASEVPYLCQYDNRLDTGNSAEATAVAMLLRYYGVHISPDTLIRDTGRAPRGPFEASEAFNNFARKAGIPERLRGHEHRDDRALRAAVAGGNPAIVHGAFAPGGHAVLALELDDYAWTVNDPGGHWSGEVEGGYGWNCAGMAGRRAQYSRRAFAEATTTLDGAATSPVRWLEVYRMDGVAAR